MTMQAIKSLLQQAPITASAPCRLDMGGTLDLSTFYLPLGYLKPCTFNAALDMRTHISLKPHANDNLLITSRGLGSLEVDLDQAPLSHPLGLMVAVASCFRARGVHIHIDSTSPPRSALGGSSVAAVALIWAFVKALARAGQSMPDPESVADLAHRFEQSVAGVVCGIQDQLAAACGGMNVWHWRASPTGPAYERQVFSANQTSSFSEHILVAYCGAPHVSKDVNATWVKGFLKGANRGVWRRIVGLSRAFVRALAKEDYGRCGQIMNRETDLRVALTPGVLDPMGKKTRLSGPRPRMRRPLYRCRRWRMPLGPWSQHR